MTNTRNSGGDQREKERPAEAAGLFRYLGISAFCLIFSLIYGLFSHGIRSPWMTYLAAWPLLLGALPAALGIIMRRGSRAGQEPGGPEADSGEGETADRQTRLLLMTDLYPFGIAALTLASMLKGVLEIAGTDSLYPDLLLGAGVLMILSGIAARVLYRRRADDFS